MAIISVSLPPGVVKGATPYDSPGRWWDANLMRWRGAVMEPVGGWERASAAPMGSIVRKMHVWRDNANIERLLLGEDEALVVETDGDFVDITPSNFTPLTDVGAFGYGVNDYSEEEFGTPRSTPSETYADAVAIWTMDNWGEDVLACASSDGRILYYDVTNSTTDVLEIGKRSISTVARNANIVTLTTVAPHDFTAGRSITINGVTDTSFNGTFTIVTTPTDTTITYAQTAANATSSGGLATLDDVARSCRAVLVTPERHVQAIGIGGNPRRFAWSSREDFTDWVFTSTTNTAGYLDLEASTPLRSMAKVREGTLIFSESEVFLSRFVGSPFVYNAQILGETRLIAPNAFATFEGRCVWLSRTGFRLYDGGSFAPIQCDVLDYVLADIDPITGPTKTFGSWNGTFPEVWFFYPSVGSAECDKYVIWNYSEKWWSVGSLPRTAMAPAAVRKRPFMAGVDKFIYDHEYGWTAAGVSRVGTVWAETGALGLENGAALVELKQLMPANARGPNSMQFRFYGRMTPEGAERQFGPYAPRSDGYVDTRVNAREARMRVEATQDADWSLGPVRMDVRAGARR
jgi:hypothetical protein